MWTRACAAGLHGVLVAAQRHGPPPVRCGGSEPRGRGPRGPSGGVVAVAGSCACGRGCVRSPVACSLARGRVLCQTRSKFWCSLHAQHQRRKPLQPTRAVRARARAQPPGMCTPLGRVGPAAMQTCVTPQRSPVDRSRLPQPRDRLPGQPWAGGRPAAGSWGHRAAPLLVAGTPTACRIRSESRGARCALRSAGDRRRRAPRPSVDSCGCAYRAHSVGEQKRRMAGLGRV